MNASLPWRVHFYGYQCETGKAPSPQASAYQNFSVFISDLKLMKISLIRGQNHRDMLCDSIRRLFLSRYQADDVVASRGDNQDVFQSEQRRSGHFDSSVCDGGNKDDERGSGKL